MNGNPLSGVSLQFNPPVPSLRLQQSDFVKLGGIPRELIDRAGIFRVSSEGGAFLVGRRDSKDYSGRVFPNIWPAERSPRSYRLRRDNPDIRYEKGHRRVDQKYLSEPIAKNLLYVPPREDAAALSDCSIPIIVTEGEKKALALAGIAKGPNQFLAIGLSGIWNFRDNSGKTNSPTGQRVSVNAPIADLNRIHWDGRKVLIVFDTNVASNPSVAAARNQLAIELVSRRANVHFVDLPEGDAVNGVDDYIAIHGSSAALSLIDQARPFDPSEKLAKLHYTDFGNEQAFEMLFGARYLYHIESGMWLMWNGTVWDPDEVNRVDRDMLAVAMARLDATAKINDDPLAFKLSGDPRDSQKKAIGAALKLQNIQGRQAALNSAKSNPRFARTAADFDQHDLLLACANGVIDLETGELRHGRREDMLTIQSPTIWEPGADASSWVKFLKDIFKSNPELVDFMQVLVGYSLTGLTVEEILLILHGTGRNGKGTLLRVLIAMLGRYGATTEFSTLIQDRDGSKSPRNDIAAIAGKRFVSAQESKQGAQLDESLVKSLTGGDMITARFLHKEFFTFRPTWKIWLATNHKPEIKGSDVGIWSRPRLIPFCESFEGREDKGLKQRLLAPAQLSAVLKWAVDGCRIYLREGLKAPACVTAATAAYRHEQNVITRFIDERCKRVDSGLSIRARDLYLGFIEWTKLEEIAEPPSEKSFGLAMAELGLQKVRRSAGIIYPGIQIDQQRILAEIEETSEAEAIRRQDLM
jgi:putative DNA primase/helicase